MSQAVEFLKPLSCGTSDGAVHTVFDGEELRRYVHSTKDTILWVKDAAGNRAPIRVEFLRETLI
jgi:hypothetical protein